MLIVYILKSSRGQKVKAVCPTGNKMAKVSQLTLHLTVGLGHLPRQPTVSGSRDEEAPSALSQLPVRAFPNSQRAVENHLTPKPLERMFGGQLSE